MDQERTLQDAIRTAYHQGTPLEIIGAGSRRFYGRTPIGTPLYVNKHQGILEYHPDELVIHARAGTPLIEIEQALAQHGQCLAFDPPRFQPESTFGGAVAMGLAGPARPWHGAIRDHLLGVKLLDGRGEILNLGGRVVKNVAGYDLFRPMAGAMGTLGLMLEITVRVWPQAQKELSLRINWDSAKAIKQICQWSGKPLPLTGAVHQDDSLLIRLAGLAPAIAQAQQVLPGIPQDLGTFWTDLRDQQLAFFKTKDSLWRFSLPAATSPLSLPTRQLLDWGGAQRWVQGPADPAELSALAQQHQGHVGLFRGEQRDGNFLPKDSPLQKLTLRIKKIMDPKQILNRGRLFPEDPCKLD